MATKPLTQTTGRRKEAVARVRLRPGTGAITVNSKAIEAYFTTATGRMQVTEPLRLTQTADVYDVDATIDGGGISGQAGALGLGIARALVSFQEDYRAAMREHGLLTRDSRAVERKKYGKMGARRSFQYSKR